LDRYKTVNNSQPGKSKYTTLQTYRGILKKDLPKRSKTMSKLTVYFVFRGKKGNMFIQHGPVLSNWFPETPCIFLHARTNGEEIGTSLLMEPLGESAWNTLWTSSFGNHVHVPKGPETRDAMRLHLLQ